MQTLTRRFAATSPGHGRGDHVSEVTTSVSLSLLPVREKVAEGRMRGGARRQATHANPHPPLRGDLSRPRER